jgi:hypothetical protein
MSTSQNGWSASPSLAIRDLSAGGAEFVPGVRDNDDVATVLRYVAQQFNDRVEFLRSGWCWGFSFRANANNPNSLSNHASGTAIDCNAPLHPNGVPTAQTFTPVQVSVIRRILAEVDGTVAWGGDFRSTPDAMHFEIVADAATLARTANRLREESWSDMASKEEFRAVVREELAALENAEQIVKTADGSNRTMTLRQLRREVWQKLAKG